MIREKICGVYMIQSKIKPERVYVGSAMNIFRRWYKHRNELKTLIHHSPKLQRHYNKYGKDDLVFEIIECGEYFNKTHLLARENGWYERFSFEGDRPYFNTVKIAGSCFGYKHTQEARNNMAKAQIKRNIEHPTTEAARENMRRAQKGHPSTRGGVPNSPEHNRKISESQIGKVISLESRKKMSISQTGKKQSQETKDKKNKAIREAWIKKTEKKVDRLI